MAEAKKPAKQPKLTPEQQRERDYEQARAMESWVPWAGSWRDRAELCEQAAAAYAKLGDYKDCAEGRKRMEEQRQKALTEERDKTFTALREELKQSKSAQDYYYAAEKLERYQDIDEAKQLKRAFKRRRKELLGRRRMMKRVALAAVCLCAALLAVLLRLHIPQYTLGRVFQAVGRYDYALNWYNRSGSFSDAKKRVKLCRYQRGLYFQEQGRYQAAYQKFRETKTYQDSAERCVDCIRALLRDAQPGDLVKLGKVEGEFQKWIVLENDGAQVTLLAEFSEGMVFDSKARDWPESEIHDWLNKEFLDTYFLDFEQKLLVNPTGEGDGAVYLLSAEEFERFAPVLKGTTDDEEPIDPFKLPSNGYWLRTPAQNEGGEAIVRSWNAVDYYGLSRKTGMPHVRPAITVSLTDE